MKNNMSKFKRMMCVACVVVLTMGVFAVPAYAKVGASYTSRVSGLRIHSKPSGTSAIVGKLQKGEKVIHKATSKGWWKIKATDGSEGYVYRGYLKPVENTIKKNAYYSVYKISNLTVRKGPRAAAAKVGSIKRGTTVQLTGKQGGWAYIKLSNGNKGWVQIKYLNYLRG